MRRMFSEKQLKEMTIQNVNQGIESGEVKIPNRMCLVSGDILGEGGETFYPYPQLIKWGESSITIFAHTGTYDFPIGELYLDYNATQDVYEYFSDNGEFDGHVDGFDLTFTNTLTGETKISSM